MSFRDKTSNLSFDEFFFGGGDFMCVGFVSLFYFYFLVKIAGSLPTREREKTSIGTTQPWEAEAR